MSETKYMFVKFIKKKLNQIDKENDFEIRIDISIEIFQYILKNVNILKQHPQFYIVVKNKLANDFLNNPKLEQYPDKYKTILEIYNKIFKTDYKDKKQSKFINDEIKEHLIPDLANIASDYLDDDRCSMLTEEGDRCAYKNIYVKVVNGTRYKEDCKFYCKTHYERSFKRIKETQPELVNLKNEGFDQDYLIDEWFITINDSEKINLNDLDSQMRYEYPLDKKDNKIFIYTTLKGKTFPKDDKVEISFPDFTNFNLDDLIDPTIKPVQNKRWISSSKWKYDPEYKIVYLRYVLYKT